MKSFSLTDLAFLGAAGGEVGDSLIPCMTGWATPTGVVSDGRLTYYTNEAWKAFDCSASTFWHGYADSAPLDRYYADYRVGSTGALTPTRWVINWKSAAFGHDTSSFFPPITVKLWAYDHPTPGISGAVVLDSFVYNTAVPAAESTFDQTFTNTTSYTDFKFQIEWNVGSGAYSFESEIRSIRIL
jgi:hypothetical protein